MSQSKASVKILLIEGNGDLKCLWTDKIPLTNLGAVSVERASNVEFDSTNGTWFVKLAGTDEIIGKGYTKRKDAIDFEVEYLNKTLL